MKKWKKQSHVIYQCKYHLVWVPKYRYKILTGDLRQFLEDSLRMLCEWKRVEILEMSIMEDHVHMIIDMPPRLSISEIVGILKGKSAIKIFKSFPILKKKPYWGNHFWARGYCVSTIGIDENKIRKYVKYQEDKEKQEEQQQKKFEF